MIFFSLPLSLGLGMPTRLPTLPTHDLMGKRLELRVHRLQKFQIDSMAKYGPTSSNLKPRSCRKKTNINGRKATMAPDARTCKSKKLNLRHCAIYNFFSPSLSLFSYLFFRMLC